jgi:hypothetical protein
MTSEEISAANDELARAYQLTFNSPSGQIVLLDMMKFGRLRAPIESQIDEGKRQAVLRIMNFTLLTTEQLEAAYRGRISVAPQPER